MASYFFLQIGGGPISYYGFTSHSTTYTHCQLLMLLFCHYSRIVTLINEFLLTLINFFQNKASSHPILDKLKKASITRI